MLLPSSPHDALNSNTSKPRNLPRRRRAIYYAPHKGVNLAFQGNSITEGQGAHKLPIAPSPFLAFPSPPWFHFVSPPFLNFSFLNGQVEDNISFVRKFCYYISRYRCSKIVGRGISEGRFLPLPADEHPQIEAISKKNHPFLEMQR